MPPHAYYLQYLICILLFESRVSACFSVVSLLFPSSLISLEMSSDEYFDELDSAFLQEVDAIEARHTQQAHASAPAPVLPPAKDVIEIDDSDDSDDYGWFPMNDQALAAIDKLTVDALRGQPPASKTKQWAHTTAKTGRTKPQSAKGKEKAYGSFADEVNEEVKEEEEEEEEPEEFEQFPPPFVSTGCVMCLCIYYCVF